MRFYIGLLFLSLVGCASMQPSKLSRVEKENIKNSLYTLTSDEFEGRDSDKAGGHMAADFLADRLESYGIQPFFTSYYDTLSNYANSWNVVGFIPGKDSELKDEIIVLGAHYDHVGFIKPIEGD